MYMDIYVYTCEYIDIYTFMSDISVYKVYKECIWIYMYIHAYISIYTHLCPTKVSIIESIGEVT